MSDTADFNTKPSLEETIRRIVREEIEAIETSRTGTIVSYDPVTRSATVQPNGKTRYVHPETGVMTEEVPAPITNVPVHFDGGGLFESAFDIPDGIPCKLDFIKHSLEDWASTGIDGDRGEAPPFQLSDCIAKVGLHHFAAAGVPVPNGIWRIGAKDGPQIIFDTNTLSIEIRALNQVVVYGGARVDVRSDGDVFNQGVWVDPTAAGS